MQELPRHYYQIKCGMATILDVPVRCTAQEASTLLHQFKEGIELSVNGVDVPEYKTCEDRSMALLEEVPAYVANEMINMKKAAHADHLHGNKLTINDATIKQAYRECGAKLKDIKRAQELITMVMELAADCKTAEELCNIISECVNDINND